MHQADLLHHGDNAATLQYCPEAVTLLMLVCLFHKVPGSILVDLGKNQTEQKMPVQNTP